MKSVSLPIAIATLALLTACQGSNPFNRESNPVRNYPRVSDSIQKRENAVPYGMKGEPDSRCRSPFGVTSNSPEAGNVFSFLEDSASSFEVSILNRMGDGFEVEAKGLPQGAEFKLLRQVSVSSAVYQLSWTPKDVIGNNQGAIRYAVTLNLRSKLLGEKCTGAMGTEPLNLLVEKTKDRPVVSVVGLPNTPIKYGRDVKFQIQVTDKLATEEKPPVLSGFTFDPSMRKTEGDVKTIDATGAVANCDQTPKFKAGKFEFNCSFLTTGLQQNNPDKVDGLLNSGKIAKASFLVSAKSRVTDRTSNVFEASVRVQFEKVAASQGTKP